MASDLWPHQRSAIDAVDDAIGRGVRRVLLTSPTGMGKSRIICELITALVEAGWAVVLYTNRRLLIEQLMRVLDEHGIDYGVRAAGYDRGEGGIWPVQIASLPTERSRVLKRGTWQIHGLGRKCLAIVDEAHLNNGPQDRAIFARHVEAGHHLLGITATPLDLGGSYDELIVAGTVRAGQECGALVRAVQYDFASPDLRNIKGVVEGEDLTESQACKAMKQPGLIGRVFDAFDRLNPDRRPTILFASGVPESIWFAEEFTKRGVTSAHIDSKNVWIDGRLEHTSPELRRRVLEGSRAGEIVVLCNRFVLREGIDAPWLSHGIFATPFGSLQTFLQSGGRLLRASPGKTCCTVQDHGGNFLRHGSLNEDRDFFLELTGAMAFGLRADRLRAHPERQPFRCPKCGRLWPGAGRRCSPALGGCGHVLDPRRRSREVVMQDGTIRLAHGNYFKPRRVCRQPDGPEIWRRMYYRARSPKWNATFRQAFALFAHENDGAWPDPSWPLMPIDPVDQFRLVADVPMDRLVPRAEALTCAAES